MAWYEITHSCGHSERHQIYGTNVHGERERKAEWLSEQLCSSCWKAARQAENEKENARAKELAQAQQLPALTGSPKQVEWASSIRQSMIESLEKKGVPHAVAISAVSAITLSKWWIDNRGSIQVVANFAFLLNRDYPDAHAKLVRDLKK